MKSFYVADIKAQGELQQISEYDYATLEQILGAIDIISRCSGELWKNPEEMQVALSDSGATLLRWRATAATAGIATVRRASGDLVSLSLLVAGRDTVADAATLEAMQRHLVRELRQTAFEPGFDLVHIKERPLIATMTFARQAEKSEQMIEALADRCFAAAFFRYLGLA